MSAYTGEDPMLGDEILDLRCELGSDLIVHARMVNETPEEKYLVSSYSSL